MMCTFNLTEVSENQQDKQTKLISYAKIMFVWCGFEYCITWNEGHGVSNDEMIVSRLISIDTGCHFLYQEPTSVGKTIFSQQGGSCGPRNHEWFLGPQDPPSCFRNCFHNGCGFLLLSHDINFQLLMVTKDWKQGQCQVLGKQIFPNTPFPHSKSLCHGIKIERQHPDRPKTQMVGNYNDRRTTHHI